METSIGFHVTCQIVTPSGCKLWSLELSEGSWGLPAGCCLQLRCRKVPGKLRFAAAQWQINWRHQPLLCWPQSPTELHTIRVGTQYVSYPSWSYAYQHFSVNMQWPDVDMYQNVSRTHTHVSQMHSHTHTHYPSVCIYIYNFIYTHK